jgi:hypothetical protein
MESESVTHYPEADITIRKLEIEYDRCDTDIITVTTPCLYDIEREMIRVKGDMEILDMQMAQIEKERVIIAERYAKLEREYALRNGSRELLIAKCESALAHCKYTSAGAYPPAMQIYQRNGSRELLIAICESAISHYKYDSANPATMPLCQYIFMYRSSAIFICIVDKEFEIAQLRAKMLYIRKNGELADVDSLVFHQGGLCRVWGRCQPASIYDLLKLERNISWFQFAMHPDSPKIAIAFHDLYPNGAAWCNNTLL